jgi:hypothetical protein
VEFFGVSCHASPPIQAWASQVIIAVVIEHGRSLISNRRFASCRVEMKKPAESIAIAS